MDKTYLRTVQRPKSFIIGVLICMFVVSFCLLNNGADGKVISNSRTKSSSSKVSKTGNKGKTSSSSSSKSKQSKSSSSFSKKTGLLDGSKTISKDIAKSVKGVGTETTEHIDKAADSAVKMAKKSAVTAQRSAFGIAELPLNLVDDINNATWGRIGGHSPGYDQAAKIIVKNRFSRSLSMLASRAVARHPLVCGNYLTRTRRLLSRQQSISRSGMINPCPTARIGRTVSMSHDGLDMLAPTGTPIYAALPGVVIYSGHEFSGYGNIIILSHGGDLYTLYAHNSKNLVDYGRKVNIGQKIALVGATGRATAPHVHFEIRHGTTPVDPLNFISR